MSDVDYLYEDAGSGQLSIGPDGRAVRLRDDQAQTRHPLQATLGSIGTPFSQSQPPAKAKGMGGTKMPSPTRQMTEDELLQWAEKTQAKMTQDHLEAMGAGPAVAPNDAPPPWLQSYMDNEGR